jgi:hypothetical protein
MAESLLLCFILVWCELIAWPSQLIWLCLPAESRTLLLALLQFIMTFSEPIRLLTELTSHSQHTELELMANLSHSSLLNKFYHNSILLFKYRYTDWSAEKFNGKPSEIYHNELHNPKLTLLLLHRMKTNLALDLTTKAVIN